jgi:hypothetical protein
VLHWPLRLLRLMVVMMMVMMGDAATCTRLIQLVVLTSAEDDCNPEGEYVRIDKDTASPLTNKCCSGLSFGCVDSAGNPGCRDPATLAVPSGAPALVYVYKYCYNPASPVFEVEFPRRPLQQGASIKPV